MSNDLTKKNQTTIALAKQSQSALAKCDHAIKIWTRSRSGVALRNITIGNEQSPLRQMRKVVAELQKKKLAMVEAKYKVLKNKKSAEMKRDEATRELNPLKKEYLELEAEELEIMSDLVEQPYQGAMREVIELTILHDALEKKIRKENNGKLDEEVFEREESKYWVKRSFAQSLRDMRQSGKITTGNQELLEQIGLDPSVVKKILEHFIELNRGDTNPSGYNIEQFLEECAEKYHTAAASKMERMGLPCDIETDHLMLELPEE